MQDQVYSYSKSFLCFERNSLPSFSNGQVILVLDDELQVVLCSFTNLRYWSRSSEIECCRTNSHKSVVHLVWYWWMFFFFFFSSLFSVGIQCRVSPRKRFSQGGLQLHWLVLVWYFTYSATEGGIVTGRSAALLFRPCQQCVSHSALVFCCHRFHCWRQTKLPNVT